MLQSFLVFLEYFVGETLEAGYPWVEAWEGGDQELWIILVNASLC